MSEARGIEKGVDVEIRSSAAGIDAAWADLVRRADPNVFMDPAVTGAAKDAGLARMHTLLAWDTGTEPRQLVGLWTLAEEQMSPIGPKFLMTPQHLYAFVGVPVIDVDWTEAVTIAFFDAIARHPSLPKVVRLQDLDGGSATHTAIASALAGRRTLVLAEYERAFMTRESGPKRSGSTRKKLRQHWNRLSDLGSLTIDNRRTGEAMRDAFEVFLAMEARSWKGPTGTALLSKDRDARYARAMFAGLAGAGNASVALLSLDGTPIACQVLLYCGDQAYTWKTAYDGAYEKHSPGALLVDRLAGMLFDEGCAAIDSCTLEGSYMAAIWSGRRRTVDMVADLGLRRSPAFDLIVLRTKARASALKLYRHLRARGLVPAPRRTSIQSPENPA